MYIRYVKQQHKYGCVPATLAMLTGASYDAVTHWLGNSFKKGGTQDGELFAFLIEHGHAFSVNRNRETLFDGPQLAMVRKGEGHPRHAVLLFGDGQVMDPAGATSRFEYYGEFFFSVALTNRT